MNAGGARAGDTDGVIHYRPQAALIDVAHREGGDA